MVVGERGRVALLVGVYVWLAGWSDVGVTSVVACRRDHRVWDMV